MLKPAKYITPKVPTSERGTATPGMIVAGTFRRNRNTTITTSATEIMSSICTSSTEARIVMVRSVRGMTSIEAGRLACNCGRSSLIRSTTWITLAPGWR